MFAKSKTAMKINRMQAMPTARPTDIGARLGLLRKIRNLRQNQVCAATGIPANTYNNYERGRTRPDTDNGIALCVFFGVTMDYLYLGNMAGVPFDTAKEIESLINID